MLNLFISIRMQFPKEEHCEHCCHGGFDQCNPYKTMWKNQTVYVKQNTFSVYTIVSNFFLAFFIYLFFSLFLLFDQSIFIANCDQRSNLSRIQMERIAVFSRIMFQSHRLFVMILMLHGFCFEFELESFFQVFIF